MNELFGPHTKLNKYEEEIAKILLSENKALYPIQTNKLLKIFEQDKVVLEDYFPKNSDLEILSGGWIIPVDVLNIKNNEFFSSKIIKDYKDKFIALPDFLYVYKYANCLDVLPLDVKNGSSPFIYKNKFTHQISASNTAQLIAYVPYIKTAIEKISDSNEQLNIQIHNGFFIQGKVKSVADNKKQKKLEEKIRDELKAKGIFGGISLISNTANPKVLVPKITKQENKLFIRNQNYEISTLTYAEFKNELKFIKNRIYKNGFYGCEVIALGADNKKLIRQLVYDSNSSIKTYSPRLTKLNSKLKELEDVVEITTKQIEEMLNKSQKDLIFEFYNEAYNKLSKEIYSQTLNEGINQIKQRKHRLTKSIKESDEYILNLKKQIKTVKSTKEKEELNKKYVLATEDNKTKKLKTSKILFKLQKQQKELKEEFRKGLESFVKTGDDNRFQLPLNDFEKNVKYLSYNKPSNSKKFEKLRRELIKKDKVLTKKLNEKNALEDALYKKREELYKKFFEQTANKEVSVFIENKRTKQVTDLVYKKNDVQIKISALKELVIKSILEEVDYLDKNQARRMNRDKINTNQIKLFHKKLPYKIAKKNLIALTNFTLYLNLNNATVYKIQFYNSLNGSLKDTVFNC